MKASLTSLIMLLFIMNANIHAQANDNASIDIRAILEKQISEIRSRENQKQEVAVETKQQAAIVSLNTVDANDTVKEFLSKDVAARIFIVIEILMIAGLVYLWGTKNSKNKKRKIAILKENIRKLREERIGSLQSKSLSMLRGKLRYDPIKINDNGKDITFRARKNNIGKGEVHLAAKIKLLVGDYK
jgi:hypothetical protein